MLQKEISWSGTKRCRRPNILAVARRAGVSSATVSRVLRGKPGVSPQTHKRTLAAVQAMGYKPHPKLSRFFSLLHSQSTNTVGFLIDSEIHNLIQAKDGFYSRHLIGVQKAVRRRGYHLLLADSTLDMGPNGRPLCVTEGRVDGLIVDSRVGGFDPQVLADVTEDVAVVLLNCDTRVPGIDAVIPDVEWATRVQVDHLRNLGHRRIACFRPRPSAHWQDRRFWREFEEYGRNCGLDMPEEYLEPIKFGRDEHPAAIGSFLDRVFRPRIAPTAILTYDLYAGELIRQLHLRGLDAPKDVSLVGFDDYTHGYFCTLPLTTFRQDFDAMADAAVDLLQGRLKAPQRPARVVEIAGKFIERASTAPAPTEPHAERHAAKSQL